MGRVKEEKESEEKSEKRTSQKKEDQRNTVFFQYFVASEVLRVGSTKAADAGPPAEMRR